MRYCIKAMTVEIKKIVKEKKYLKGKIGRF